MTALFLAAASGHEEVVSALLEAHGPLEAPSDWGVTPLCAAAREGHLGCCRILLASGADPIGADLDSPTALDYSASHAHLPVLEMLLREVHSMTDVTTGQLLYFGLSRPLVSAASHRHEEVCRRLLSRISEEELAEALSLAAAATPSHPLFGVMAAWSAAQREDVATLQAGIPEAVAAAASGLCLQRDAAVREAKRLRRTLGYGEVM